MSKPAPEPESVKCKYCGEELTKYFKEDSWFHTVSKRFTCADRHAKPEPEQEEKVKPMWSNSMLHMHLCNIIYAAHNDHCSWMDLADNIRDAKRYLEGHLIDTHDEEASR